MKPRTIFETPDKTYRILEYVDDSCSMDDLKGEMFDPKVITDIDPELLRRDELKFERKVENEGVFGYVLERWNPAPGVGYDVVDSCFGFIGEYHEGALDYDHDIVAEMKQTIAEGGTK